MIDFRYHVVSIIAVFLALSVGLVLGSSFLKEAAVRGLDGTISDLRRQNEDLRKQVGNRDASLKYLDGVLGQAVPQLVDGKLKDRSVVVVALPGADGKKVDSIVSTLEQADATVTGQVFVKSAWNDPKQEAELAAAATVPVGGTTQGNGDSASTAPEKASVALAAAIARHTTEAPAGTPPAGQTPPPASPSPTGTPAVPNPATSPTATTPPAPDTSVLTRLKDANFIDIKGDPAKGATLTVLVAPPGAVTGENVDKVYESDLYLARALAKAGEGVVMVGATASAQEGGVIQALRSDDETKKLVSSVDNADTPAGLVATVWVLVGAQADGRVGHYGNVGSTDGWLPKLPEEKTSP